MKQRIITGVIGGIFIAYVTYKGGLLYDFIYLGITLIAIYELSKVLFSKKVSFSSILNYILAVCMFCIKRSNDYDMIGFIGFIYVAINFIMYVSNKHFDLKMLCETIFIAMYVVFLMYHMILLNGNAYVWLVYIIAFGTDTFAYFSGKFFGKRKLYPEVSPHKTIEGAIGGIIGCTALSIAYFSFLDINKYIYIIIFSILASIFSMFGDLLASKIKREHHIKDYNNILPGHGGILDRFDSVLFVAPVVYYFITHFI